MTNAQINELYSLGLRETLKLTNPELSWRDIHIKCLHHIVSKQWKGTGITVTFT